MNLPSSLPLNQKTECDVIAARNFYGFKINIIIWIVQIILSFTAFFLNTHFICFRRKTLYFHPNIRALLQSVIIVNIIHSFFYFCGQLFQLLTFLSPSVTSNVCHLMISNKLCILFRLPILWSINAWSIIHLLFSVERLVAFKLLDLYARGISHVKLLLIVILTVSTLSAIYECHHWFLTNEKVLYCSRTHIQDNYMLVSKVILVINITSMVIHLWNMLTSRRDLLNNCFDMTTKYQLKEFRNTLAVIHPIVLFQFFTHGLYCLVEISWIPSLQSTSFQTALAALIYLVPIQCVFSPLVILRCLREQKRSRHKKLIDISSQNKEDARIIYFKELQNVLEG